MKINQQSHIKTLIITFIFCIFLAIPSVTNASPTCATVGGTPINANDPACYTTQTTNCTWSFYGYDCCNSSGACHYEKGNCDAGETPRIGYGHPIVLYKNSCGGVSCNNPHSGPPNNYTNSSNTCYYLVPTAWGACNASTGMRSATSVTQESTPGTSCSNESMTKPCNACGTNNGKTFTNIHEQSPSTFCAGGRSVTWQDSAANDGTWNWQCGHSSYGSIPNCSANKGAETPTCGSRARNYSSTTTSYPTGSVWCDSATSTVINNSVVGSYFPVLGGRTTWKCQGKYGGAIITCAATRDNAPVSYSCTGSVPAGATACFGDSQNPTANIAWMQVGSCTNARKCEYMVAPPPSNLHGDCATYNGCDTSVHVNNVPANPKCTGTRTPTNLCISDDGNAKLYGNGPGSTYWHWSCFGDTFRQNDYCRVYKPCGNSAIDVGEACDDGNRINGDGCNSRCQIEVPASVCGNNTTESGEACDDGNRINGDGCSSTCQLEPSCGTSHEKSFVSKPTADLCDNATASGMVEVNKKFNWDCGATISCTATKIEPPAKCGTCTNIPVTQTGWNSCSFCINGARIGVEPTFSPTALWKCENADGDITTCNTATYCTQKSCTVNNMCQSTPKPASDASECSSTCNSNADCSTGRLIETRP